MKILFISHHRESSGVGRAAREYLLSLKSVGIEVAARAVKLGLVTNDIPDEIKEMEKVSSQDCDYCIQFVLPHHFRYDGSFKKCIGIFDYEANNFQASGWPYLINMFNYVWVPSMESFRQAVQSGIKKEKISVVPHAVNPERYRGPFKKLIGGDSFIFYFMGECNERKNLKSLIKAFHSTFAIDEPVSLVIKTHKHGLSPKDCREYIQKYIDNIKVGLRIFDNPAKYKQDVIITDYLTDQDILNLHYSCDCLVSPSHGEAFCYPVLDALGMGKPVIISDTGQADLVITHSESVHYKGKSQVNGIKIDGNYAPVEGMMDTFPALSTGLESWFNIDEEELKLSMREVFNNRNSSYFTSMIESAKETPKKYSYKVIGEKIKKLLEK